MNARILSYESELVAATGGRFSMLVKGETDSTNLRLKELAEQGAPEGLVMVADCQTAGRGRGGKAFFSPAGTGLYFSVLLRPAMPDPLRITVAAGAAVACAVERELSIPLQIKWVNDLYWHDRKVAGILAEGKIASGNEPGYCVLGIGLNVFAPETGFGTLGNIAGALLNTAPSNGVRARMAAAILDCFFAYYRAQDPARVLEAYRARSYLSGKTVSVLQGGQTWRGTVAGINDQAALLLRLPDGTVRAFHSGEATVEDFR